jgi:hypothetical protein
MKQSICLTVYINSYALVQTLYLQSFCLNAYDDVSLILIQHKVVCLCVNVKLVLPVCLVEHHAMKTCEVSGHLHTVAALPTGEEPPVSIAV